MLLSVCVCVYVYTHECVYVYMYLCVCMSVNLWSGAYLGKLIVFKLVNKFPHFMETESSFPCSQQPSTFHYHEPDESIHVFLLYLKSILITS